MNKIKNAFIYFIIIVTCIALGILAGEYLFRLFPINSKISESNKPQVEKRQPNSNKKQNITELLSESSTSDLHPRSLSNLDRIFGFRGLKLHMNVDSINFNRIIGPRINISSPIGDWKVFESKHGYVSYYVDISMNSPYSLSGSSIQTIELSFIDKELAQITMSFDLYEFNIDGNILDKDRYNRLLNSMINTFGRPTKPEYSEQYIVYNLNENQELPIEQNIQVILNEWKTDAITMTLRNVLPNIKKAHGVTYHSSPKVSLVYRSMKYNERINEINRMIDEENKKYYIEENLRMQIGDF